MIEEITGELAFPEGPIALQDGSVLVVEIARGTLSRVTPKGSVEVVSKLGGGPNGAAMGPDGAVYVCNNGGFSWSRSHGRLHVTGTAEDYSGGRIERVDIATGESDVLYSACDGEGLNGPNDIVFDADGGFWFTDLGKSHETYTARGGVYYAKPDGSSITRVISNFLQPNGIGLSRDEKTLYVAETIPGRLWAYAIRAPGEIVKREPITDLLVGLPGWQLFDSLALDEGGNVCVATIPNGEITIVSPDASRIERFQTDDPFTTNICFGGEDLRTAFMTLSSTGRLVSTHWRRAGLPLNFLNG